jgi:hypothetical protein
MRREEDKIVEHVLETLISTRSHTHTHTHTHAHAHTSTYQQEAHCRSTKQIGEIEQRARLGALCLVQAKAGLEDNAVLL